jgi:DNA primase catalytic subunit
MIINAYEIPEIVNKCNEQNWNFNFNTVLKPWHQALWSLDIGELQQIVDYYKGHNLDQNSSISEVNNLKFYSLISLLENWILRVKIFDAIDLNDVDLKEMRKQLSQRFQNVLSNSDNSMLAKMDNVVNRIPDKLIRKALVDYVNKLSESFITKEFVENDEDTIVDHLCIVAFNL